MKTFKYYRTNEDIDFNEDVEVFHYADNLVGIKSETHNYDYQEVTFDNCKAELEASHLCKELNKTISSRIKTVYSIDDEIAMLKKADTDIAKIAYNNFVDAIKTEVNAQKVAVGLKQ